MLWWTNTRRTPPMNLYTSDLRPSIFRHGKMRCLYLTSLFGKPFALVWMESHFVVIFWRIWLSLAATSSLGIFLLIRWRMFISILKYIHGRMSLTPIDLLQVERKTRKARFPISVGVLVRYLFIIIIIIIIIIIFKLLSRTDESSNVSVYSQDVILAREWKLQNWKSRLFSLSCFLVSSTTLLTSLVNVRWSFPSQIRMISIRPDRLETHATSSLRELLSDKW